MSTTRTSATDKGADSATTRAAGRDEAAWDGDTRRGEPEFLPAQRDTDSPRQVEFAGNGALIDPGTGGPVAGADPADRDSDGDAPERDSHEDLAARVARLEHIVR